MEKAFNLKSQIEQVDNPEVLRATLLALLGEIDSLKKRLDVAGETTNENKKSLILEKKDKLENIRHGLSEINERMTRPYVISAELQAVKEVLDVLANSGDCNSVILEGEPGTGKTQWAYSEVGQELMEGKDVMLIHVRVKDTMRAQDLLYSIDDVRRLSDAQAQAQVPDEIKNEAFAWKQKIVSGEVKPTVNEEYIAFKAKMEAVVELGETAKDLDYANYVDFGPLGEAIYQSGKGKKVYLLIDEIEKGREELMTGILDEIENLTFTISETGTIIKGNKKNLRIVITTNTEDSDKIPASFRRRSLYHYIDYPSPNDLAQIVQLNFPDIRKELLDYAISVFYSYHQDPDIQKKPSTPELLSWVRVLSKEYKTDIPEDVPHREILLKYQEDQGLDIGELNLNLLNQAENNIKLPNYVYRALHGGKVYRFTDKMNSKNYSDSFSDIYAELYENDINYVTPRFGNGYDENDNYSRNICLDKFQVITPGVESLGDNYYSIPDDKVSLFSKLISEKIEILPAGQKFIKITEKDKNTAKGVVKVGDYEFEAYMVEDGRVVVNKPYELFN